MGRRLAAIALGTTLMPGVASAQRYAVDRLEPSERGSDWTVNESLDLRGWRRPSAGIVGSYAYRPLVVRDAAGAVIGVPVRDLAVAHVGGAVVLGDRVRVGADLPLALLVRGRSSGSSPAPAGEQAFGDLRLGADVRLAGEHRRPFTAAIGLRVWAPSGQASAWVGDGAFRAGGRALVAGEIGPLAWAAQAGVAYRDGSELTAAAAVGARVGVLVVGPELLGTTRGADPFARGTTPVEALLGARVRIGDRVRLGAGAGRGVTTAAGSPALRTFLAIEWTDLPGDAGRRPGDLLRDRDGDGIDDAHDACPIVKGVPTDDPLTTGCPPDRDRDGVTDADDVCPDVPGIATNDPGTTGCPPDTDGDGIDDLSDACPTAPGPRTLDPMTNGCNLDRDQDAIPNAADACPDDAGAEDPDPRRNGCPPVFVRDREIRLLDPPRFRGVELVAQESPVLERLRQLLVRVPGNVRVEGHTDDRGDAAENRKSSAARAAAVVKWLVAHGIDPARLTSEGVGPDRPIDTNETEAGRAHNRRIELHLLP